MRQYNLRIAVELTVLIRPLKFDVKIHYHYVMVGMCLRKTSSYQYYRTSSTTYDSTTSARVLTTGTDYRAQVPVRVVHTFYNDTVNFNREQSTDA